MSFFKKLATLLFSPIQEGTSAASKSSYPSHEYKGFTITPQPLSDNGQYRIAGLIEKVSADQEDVKSHYFIRSDVIANADQAADLTLIKCKICIDQMGDSIFD